MLSLSKKTDYGLLLLSALAKQPKGKFTSVRIIAKDNNLPYKFLSRIATDLKASGIIKSKEGHSGGYKLSQSPQKLMISQVIEALEGEFMVSCANTGGCGCGHTCVHEGVMEVILGGMQDYSLHDLINRS